MPIEEAHKEADHQTRKLEPPQYPEIVYSDDLKSLPFAVIAK
jgi:hypothetical protein